MHSTTPSFSFPMRHYADLPKIPVHFDAVKHHPIYPASHSFKDYRFDESYKFPHISSLYYSSYPTNYSVLPPIMDEVWSKKVTKIEKEEYTEINFCSVIDDQAILGKLDRLFEKTIFKKIYQTNRIFQAISKSCRLIVASALKIGKFVIEFVLIPFRIRFETKEHMVEKTYYIPRGPKNDYSYLGNLSRNSISSEDGMKAHGYPLLFPKIKFPENHLLSTSSFLRRFAQEEDLKDSVVTRILFGSKLERVILFFLQQQLLPKSCIQQLIQIIEKNPTKLPWESILNVLAIRLFQEKKNAKKLLLS